VAKNQAKKPLVKRQQEQALRQYVFGLVAFSLGILAWMLFPGLTFSPTLSLKNTLNLRIVGLGLVYLGFTFTLERSLARSRLKQSKQYRWAFSGSLILAGCQVLAGWIGFAIAYFSKQARVFTIAEMMFVSIEVLVAAWLGALVGGLAATAVQEGIWEDNSPPTPKVKAKVLRVHSTFTGPLPETPFSKRVFDICIAASGLLLSFPLWVVGVSLVWLEDPGPILFVKNSVGKGGRNFRQFKLRTMVKGAEEATGPVMASEEDKRILMTGRVLRKTALDELPQLVNILKGEMSVVGPRPQRTVLVQNYLVEMPEYAERHKVLPGLAGLAQVAGSYYLTPHQKLRYDRLYIHNANLGFDLRLLLSAFLIAFWFRWQKKWSGRLPRRLLHGAKCKSRGKGRPGSDRPSSQNPQPGHP
jgi:lipopolysaccharide/colanic/teichoic acid biosynthesis glycosyltransferase